jgi:hypothetical protein
MFIAQPSDVGGYPVLAVNTRALTPPANPHTVTPSGYTNVELWLQQYAAAVEGQAPPSPQPPQVDGTTYVWAQSAPTLSDAQGYTYQAYLDQQPPVTLAATCGASALTQVFSCSAPMPAQVPGVHTVSFTTTSGVGESVKSQALVYTLTATAPSVTGVPPPPSGVGIGGASGGARRDTASPFSRQAQPAGAVKSKRIGRFGRWATR